MAAKRSLIGIDFDHTLLNANSDSELRKLLPDSEIPHQVKQLAKEKDGWTAYMRGIFVHMHKCGLRQMDFEKCLRAMPLMPGMKDLLTRAYESGNCDIIILSDANTFFIDYILKQNSVKHTVKDIFTNTSFFDANGCLQIQEYQTQDWCDMCTRNICKGWILEKYLKEKASEGIVYDRILYVGDGANDVCPALKLRSGDFIFPRKGFPMLKKLKKLTEDRIKAEVVPWDSGLDILKILLPESK